MFTLSEAVERLEQCSESAQLLLHDAMLDIFYRKAPAFCSAGKEAEILELENKGFVIKLDMPELSVRAIGRNELVKRLSSSGISGFKKNMKLDDLVKWCIESDAVQIETLAPEIDVVNLSPAMGKVRKKLYIYLGRKLLNESYYDPDLGAMVDVPKGSSFSAVIKLSGASSLTITFPDDEITELLDQYGCNRCKTWQPPQK